MVVVGGSRRARVAGRVTGLMALPERASRPVGGWGAPSHHWAAVIVLVLPRCPAYHPTWHVCLYLCVCVRMYACATCAYVRLCRSGRRWNGRSVDSAGLGLDDDSGDRHGTRLKQCAPCAFSNSFELLVSDTRGCVSFWDWSVHLTGASISEGVRHRGS